MPESEWRSIETAVQALIDRGVAAASAEGRLVLDQWLGLLERLTGGDRALLAKLVRVSDADHLLASGSPLSRPTRAWLQAGFAASGLTLT